MKSKLTIGILSIVALAAVFASTSFGLSSTLVGRGTIGAFSLQDKSQKLKLQSKDPLTVDIRHVIFNAGESTSWHGHAGPSLVIVNTGSLSVYEADGKACSVNTYGPGAAFVHQEDAHNFVAGGDGADIDIVYLLPEGGSPAPSSADAPGVCS